MCLTASVYKQVLHIRLTVNIRLITMCAQQPVLTVASEWISEAGRGNISFKINYI